MFTASETTRLLLFVLAFTAAIALGVVALGWLVGRLFPRVRHLAPLVIAAIACWILRSAWPLGVVWLVAGAATVAGFVARDSRRRRRGDPGAR
ncbi:MAG TPA: hypothetical protein VFL83_23335 [Anaeromyxobacter sp.]|nr:hypothetical protein [Anaeromyxobacter sp.]